MSKSPTPHRKRVKHFEDAYHCHELTFSCYQRMPLLADDKRRTMLSVAIDRACSKKGWALTAFVYMPEHVHLLVYALNRDARVDELLGAIKRPFSYRVKRFLFESKSPLLNQLTIRQRPGVTTFRFWQEGPGYDRNLTNERTVLAAIDYLHMNPVRRGLCGQVEEWYWSSARWYVDEGRRYDDQLPRITSLPANFFVGSSDGTPD